MSPITIVMEPTIIPIAEMGFSAGGLAQLVEWIATTHPACYPHQTAPFLGLTSDPPFALFPHHGAETEAGDVVRILTDNELLVELAGRLCYYSFGAKAGTPTNTQYIANTQQGPLPHKSLMYHPKMSFFLSGISRRLSHELVRHYVGADRSEEGSPSMESTRYVEHPGWFVVHPHMVAQDHTDAANQQFGPVAHWQRAMQYAYDEYITYIETSTEAFRFNAGTEPKGLDRKRIYEAASTYLPHSAMTSLLWTTNPAALAKLFAERTDIAADLEFQRLATAWKALCTERWPNLFWE